MISTAINNDVLQEGAYFSADHSGGNVIILRICPTKIKQGKTHLRLTQPLFHDNQLGLELCELRFEQGILLLQYRDISRCG